MAGLGLILAWGGYTLFIYGYGKQRWGSSGGGGPTLSISDVALPSHRAAYIVAMNAYATAHAAAPPSGTGGTGQPSTGKGSIGGTGPSGKTLGPGALGVPGLGGAVQNSSGGSV